MKIPLKRNNVLISKFMGNNSYSLGWSANGIAPGFWSPEKMLYSKEWNWIMPVVAKCKQLGMEHGDWRMENDYGNILDDLSDLDIQRLYKSVVTFIKNYNKYYEE